MDNYVCNDVFILRTPKLPIDYHKDILEKDNIYEYIKSNEDINLFTNIALQVSNQSLYKSFSKKPKNKKSYTNLNLSLLKYVIRASTRPTPFGYFACVSLGEFGDRTKIIKSNDFLHISTDHKWVNNLIRKLENDLSLSDNSYFINNDNIYNFGGRYYNPYCSGVSKNNQDLPGSDNNNIRYIQIIDTIRNTISEELRYHEIKEVLYNKYHGIKEEQIDLIFKQLIENEYIYSPFRIPSNCELELHHIKDILSKIDSNNKLLKKISYTCNMLDYFNNNKTNDLDIIKNNLTEIENSMTDIQSKDVILKADSGAKMESNILTKGIKSKIEKFASTLSLISVESNLYNKLEDFVNAFEAEYGIGVEVKLIDVINPNKFDGLRYIKDSVERKNNLREMRIKDILRNKVAENIFLKKEINFIKDDFAVIKNFNTRYPESFDLNLHITKTDDNYHLYLGPNVGSMKAGSMFQRFDKCLDENLFTRYNKMYNYLDNQNRDYIDVALNLEPLNADNANILNKTKNYKYSFTIGTTDKDDNYGIELEDIYIYLDNSFKLFFKSKSLNKNIRFISDNMLNLSFSPSKLIIFLQFVSYMYENDPISRIYDLINLDYEYVPEIKIEDIVVSPEKWVFKNIRDKEYDYHLFIKDLNQFLSKYNMKELKNIYMCFNDNRLMLNLDNELVYKMMYSEFKKYKKITFNNIEENLFDTNLILDTSNNKYIGEFVFSLYKKEKSKIQENTHEALSIKYLDRTLIDIDKDLLPFENGWIYLKIYGLGDRINNFLVNEVSNLIMEVNPISFFFIRYVDNIGPHIRLRLKFKDDKNAILNMNSIINWSKVNKNIGNLSKIILEGYNREINRYGGIEIIDLCEQLFSDDSRFVINELAENRTKTKIENLFFYDISFYLLNLYNDIEEIVKALDKVIQQKEYNSYYKENDKRFKDMLFEVQNNKLYKNDNIMMNKLTYELKIILNIIRDRLEKDLNLTTHADDLKMALIHMHCNRLTSERSLEYKYLEIVRNAMYHEMKRQDFIGKTNYKKSSNKAE